MNDRTLLELAARAAGIKARWFKVNQWRRLDGCRLHTGQKDVFGTHHRKPWSPLTDDGDALRLAVLLNLEIHSPQSDPTVMFRTAEHDVFYQDTCIRRAIVRAAAEIGKSMGGGE
ncbi:hypothetical protein AN459_14375 [Pseudomonas aeruginosa]|uniref:hypothetical protein n=1 Tax=Pseudomonas aeruginosa TaxID=287 RepID=UPI0003B97425|nr:hypothetical protein [Pseudomonas aeruginosa]ERY52208.1 hypothetical protein Q057_04747 [Pseudomonas aeruginosa BL03]KRV25247.1 hypothetical protein AN459_14375 [Pseudomonas aeruginosa]KSR15254.1 hypothetical protein APB43_22630 [Pseudomonas aeruginosa]RMK46655.1 hypothetical protein IPC92_13395 [Pseudomonas aeruginosa]HBO6773245.1 hypothetical protein [Pseudomonas aeruginosa]